MTTPKKKATRKRKPKINEEQLEMARLYEKAWNKLFESIPKSIQKDIIDTHTNTSLVSKCPEINSIF